MKALATYDAFERSAYHLVSAEQRQLSFDIQRSLRNKIARRRLLNEMQRRE